jgi:polyhydroxybutyrate depolymerase
VRALTRLAGAVLVAVAAVACGSSGAGSGSASSRSAVPASATSATSPCAPGAKVAPGRVPRAPLDTVLRVPARARWHRAPLVIALHFASGTGSQMEQATRLTPEARRDGFVVAYPSASENHFWSASADFDRLMRTLDAIERVACVDSSRVYAVGISNGGFMSTVLACRAADRIAAVALFAPGINGVGDCSPARPISVLEIHGTADPIVPYRDASGRPDEDIPAFVAAWARRDGCAATSRVRRVSATVTRFRRPGCRAGTRVEHLRLTGGRHIELLAQLRAAGVDPAREAWRFLASQRLPAS